MNGLTFLTEAGDFEFQWGRRLVLAGSSAWLKGKCLRHARKGWAELPAEEVDGPALRESWAEEGLFGPRLFLAEGDNLEKTLAKLSTKSRHRLVLRAGQWKGDVADGALIDCEPPTLEEMAHWLRVRARTEGLELDPDAAGLLARQGTELAECEYEKVACYCLASKRMRRQDVELLCVQEQEGLRGWAFLERLGHGDALNRVGEYFSGEDERQDAFRFAAVVGKPLRQLARAVHHRRKGLGAEKALTEAGVEAWNQGRAAALIGLLRGRLLSVTAWLCELDAGLKGSGPLASLRPRYQCERLALRLSGREDRPGSPPPAARQG